jgi:hypothetical protein
VCKAIDGQKKVFGVLVDIRKAFDKVWHSKLLYTLHILKIPARIGFWIMSFLDNRQFRVKVD